MAYLDPEYGLCLSVQVHAMRTYEADDKKPLTVYVHTVSGNVKSGNEFYYFYRVFVEGATHGVEGIWLNDKDSSAGEIADLIARDCGFFTRESEN